MAERTDKQTAKRMFAQTNGCPAGLMNGHVKKVEGGIVVGIHPFGFYPSPKALVCNCFMHS